MEYKTAAVVRQSVVACRLFMGFAVNKQSCKTSPDFKLNYLTPWRLFMWTHSSMCHWTLLLRYVACSEGVFVTVSPLERTCGCRCAWTECAGDEVMWWLTRIRFFLHWRWIKACSFEVWLLLTLPPRPPTSWYCYSTELRVGVDATASDENLDSCGRL